MHTHNNERHCERSEAILMLYFAVFLTDCFVPSNDTEKVGGDTNLGQRRLKTVVFYAVDLSTFMIKAILRNCKNTLV